MSEPFAGGHAPPFWADACRALARADPVMRTLTRAHAQHGLRSRGDAFATLARAIVGQQISVKAADSVWARLLAELGAMAPAAVLARRPERLAGCGLSGRKVEYLRALASAFATGAVQPHTWAALDDETLIAELMRVRGIGRWTAEMFLIFNLLRPNVLPLDDLGLVRAAGLLYFAGRAPARDELRALAQRWQPWCSVATWHLWRSLDPVPVAY